MTRHGYLRDGPRGFLDRVKRMRPANIFLMDRPDSEICRNTAKSCLPRRKINLAISNQIGYASGSTGNLKLMSNAMARSTWKFFRWP